jgi:hypothetical protein
MRLNPRGYGEWPSLRFELGGDTPVQASAKRAGQAVERATSVFERAFAAQDLGFVSFTRWRADDDAVFLPLIPASERDEVERSDGSDFYEDGGDTPFTSYTVALKPRSIDYRTLFGLVANSELRESPSLDGRAYLINASQPLVFHMYDDRGAILLAPEATTLAPLHAEFGDWLVESH